MKQPKPKKLTEEELRRYERALVLWDLALQKQERELDAREAALNDEEEGDRILEDGLNTLQTQINAFRTHYGLAVAPPTSEGGNITLGMLQDAYRESIRPPYQKPLTFREIQEDCHITPEEFVTTLKPCGPKCYEGGEHQPDCDRMIYLALQGMDDKLPPISES